MLVNNEIGVIQPIAALADMAHGAGALMLCDAVQGFGRVPIPPACDLVAMSAHKIHGPKGIGALWMRDGVDARAAAARRRPGAGGFARARCRPRCARVSARRRRSLRSEQADDAAHVERLWGAALATARPATGRSTARPDHRYHGNLNLRRDGLDVARLMSDCRDIAFSAGSACASGSGRPSHVLRALGLTDREARLGIRLGFGRYTTEDELVAAVDA